MHKNKTNFQKYISVWKEGTHQDQGKNWNGCFNVCSMFQHEHNEIVSMLQGTPLQAPNSALTGKQQSWLVIHTECGGLSHPAHTQHQHTSPHHGSYFRAQRVEQWRLRDTEAFLAVLVRIYIFFN